MKSEILYTVLQRDYNLLVSDISEHKVGKVDDIYKVYAQEGCFFFKFPNRRNKHFLSWLFPHLAVLRKKGIPTPQIRSHSKGKKLIEIEGRPGYLMECVPGKTHEWFEDEQIKELAVYQGRILQYFSKEHNQSFLNGYTNRYSNGLNKEILGDHAKSVLCAQQQILDALPNLPQYPIHGDLHSGNISIHKRKISGILDWECTSWDIRALDVARVLNYTLNSFPKDEYVACLEQYCPLQDNEKAILPQLSIWDMGSGISYWYGKDNAIVSSLQEGLENLLTLN